MQSLLSLFIKQCNSLKEENYHHLNYDKDRKDHMGHMHLIKDDDLKKNKIGVIDKFTVYTVNAEIIRDMVDIDFTTGGNPARYSYVPKDEIWLENTMSPNDTWPTIIHEYLECFMMQAHHYSYDRAHDFANDIEFKIREAIAQHKIDARDNRIGLIFANKIINKILDHHHFI